MRHPSNRLHFRLPWLMLLGLYLTLLALPAAAQLATSPWPKFHGDLRNSGVGQGAGATNLLKWSVGTSGYVVSSPVVGSDGTIYFTDPSFALSAADKALPFDGVYRISTDGKLTLLLKNYSRPNGLAFSPDEKRLYVNDTFRRLIFSYDVSPQGELSNEHLFAILTGDLAGLPNGMKTDIEGNVYCTGPGGIQVFQPDGKYMGLIYMKEVVSNFCFGDSDRKTLYITAGPSVFKLRVKIAGSKPPFH